MPGVLSGLNHSLDIHAGGRSRIPRASSSSCRLPTQSASHVPSTVTLKLLRRRWSNCSSDSVSQAYFRRGIGSPNVRASPSKWCHGTRGTTIAEEVGCRQGPGPARAFRPEKATYARRTWSPCPRRVIRDQSGESCLSIHLRFAPKPTQARCLIQVPSLGSGWSSAAVTLSGQWRKLDISITPSARTPSVVVRSRPGLRPGALPRPGAACESLGAWRKPHDTAFPSPPAAQRAIAASSATKLPSGNGERFWMISSSSTIAPKCCEPPTPTLPSWMGDRLWRNTSLLRF
jgi:hypothetical protein